MRRTITVLNVITFQLPVIRSDTSNVKGLLEWQSNAISLLSGDFCVVKRGHQVRPVAGFQGQLVT